MHEKVKDWRGLVEDGNKAETMEFFYLARTVLRIMGEVGDAKTFPEKVRTKVNSIFVSAPLSVIDIFIL